MLKPINEGETPEKAFNLTMGSGKDLTISDALFSSIRSPAGLATELSTMIDKKAKIGDTGFFRTGSAVIAASKPNPAWENPNVAFQVKRDNLLPPKHAYSIIGYDPIRKIVKFANPWNDKTFKFGEQFELPVAEVFEKFGGLGVFSGK